jgi:hypothetical protein
LPIYLFLPRKLPIEPIIALHRLLFGLGKALTDRLLTDHAPYPADHRLRPGMIGGILLVIGVMPIKFSP